MKKIVVESPTMPPSSEDWTRGRQPKEMNEIVTRSLVTIPSPRGIKVHVVGIRV
jgi:hypothetical protein